MVSYPGRKLRLVEGLSEIGEEKGELVSLCKMLPKDRRISRKLFKPLLASRKYFNSTHFTARVASSDEARIAISVSKKISKSAVVRNKIRRRVYSATRDLFPHLSKNLFLLVAKSGAEKLKGQSLKDELALLLKKG